MLRGIHHLRHHRPQPNRRSPEAAGDAAAAAAEAAPAGAAEAERPGVHVPGGDRQYPADGRSPREQRMKGVLEAARRDT